MKRNPFAVLLLAASLGLSAGATGLVATSASAAGQHARSFAISGSIVSVNTPLHQFVLLSGSTRYSILTTTQSRFTLNQAKCSLSALRPGHLVTTRGNFRGQYRVALTVQARPAVPIPVSTVPATTALTTALTNALTQERYALATYKNNIAKFGAVTPFKNIITSEEQHVSTITGLMTAHGVTVPASTTTGAVAPATRVAACQLGVTVETAIIAMYQNGLTLAKDFPDAVRVFSNLLDVSQSSHLLAFLRCS